MLEVGLGKTRSLLIKGAGSDKANDPIAGKSEPVSLTVELVLPEEFGYGKLHEEPYLERSSWSKTSPPCDGLPELPAGSHCRDDSAPPYATVEDVESCAGKR